MDGKNLTLKSINELLQEKFCVPSYQRGYRWTHLQVTDLLNDILEFHKNSEKDEFYCLQPVVLKQSNNDEWEVIDGQQRLTTIFIILKYLNERLTEEYRKALYSLSYTTREESASYLNNINVSEKDKNIDFFFIYATLETVKNWFKEKQNFVNDFESTLLNRVKVIWYEVEESTNSIDIFTRINMGKIPLTNAELIKALFLRKGNFDNNDEETITSKQVEIASEWDRIEYSLQNEEFWCFINTPLNKLSTRIEFIFNLMANKKSVDDENFTFRHFNTKFAQEKSVSIWKNIKSYFMTFEEWFNDRTLYHLVGYLISQGCNIQEIKNHTKSKTKKEFNNYLIQEIKNQVKCQIDDLDYNSDHKRIEKVLLLFNIESMIRNSTEKSRFPFDKYKQDEWSLEHIHARNPVSLKTSEVGKSWLLESKMCIIDKNRIENKSANEKVIQRIDQLLQQEKIEDEEFENIQDEIFKIFGEESDSISNLALLSGKDNSALNNNIFPVKRSKIVERDKKGSFIPICTRNVFLKYYTQEITSLYYWGEQDRICYLDAIKKTLANYLPKQVNEGLINENN